MPLSAFQAARYVDIAQFYTDDVKRHFKFFKANPAKVWDSLLAGVMDGSALNIYAPCRSHRCSNGKSRKCTMRKADRHIAGMSCTDMSLMNTGRPKAGGKSMLYFLACVGLRRKVREPVVLFENVDGFLQLLQLTLGDLYYVDCTRNVVKLCPSMNGTCVCSRPETSCFY